MLEHRTPYHNMQDNVHSILDVNRARNEIALVDIENQKVTYGLQSIYVIILNRFPMLKAILFNPIIKGFFSVLYNLISYNRKVIMPQRVHHDYLNCIPDYNKTFRWFYLFLSGIVVSSILYMVNGYLSAVLEPSNVLREIGLTVGLVLFQGAWLYFLFPKKVMDYLGNMMTISLFGAMAVLPILGIYVLSGINQPSMLLIGIAIVVIGMFLEHIRRVQLLRLPFYVTIGWVVFGFLFQSAIKVGGRVAERAMCSGKPVRDGPQHRISFASGG